MEKSRQWEAEPGQKVDIPEDLVGDLNYKVLFYQGSSFSVAWCREQYYHDGVLSLFDAVIDTSDRYQGTVLKKRLTYRPLVKLMGVQAMIFTLDKEEGEKGGD